jgi:hypothetical protein
MELNQRSSGYVDSAYYPAKEALEKTRRKGFCMFCQKSLGKGERKYHKKCWKEWYAQFAPSESWSVFKYRAIERDKRTCQICGRKEGDIFKSKDGFEQSIYLIVDHIKPIALGGEEFDLNNLQTLCQICNKRKTRYDMKLIASARRMGEDQRNLLLESAIWSNNLQRKR